MRRILLTLILVLATSTAAGGGVFVWQTSRNQNEKSVLQGDNASLRLQLRQLEEQVSKVEEKPPAPPPPPATEPTPDRDQIVAIVKAVCAAQTGVDISKGTFTLVKNNDIFAKVDYNCTAAPANTRAILKKASANWVLVYSATPAPSRAIIQKYGIPEEFR